MTQSDIDLVLKLRTRLEDEYAKAEDDRLGAIIAYLAAAQAMMRMVVRRRGKAAKLEGE